MSNDGPDPVAAIDQANAELAARAGSLCHYFNRLISEGFQRHEALELVRDYQAHLDET